MYDYAVKALIAGRKLLGDDNAFAYDLISIYRFQKNKTMLVQEYLNVIEKNPVAMQQAQGVLSAIFEDNADYDLLKSTLLRRLQKDPQNVPYAEMLTWQYIQQKDYEMALRQSIALDKRLKEPGDRIYDLSWLLISNKAYPTAVDALQYLISKGSDSQYYIPAKIQMLNTKNQMLTGGKFTIGELQQLEKEYLGLLSEFGKVSNTAFAMRQLGNLQAFYLNKPKEAQKLLEELIQVSNLPASILGQAKLDLADVYILTGEVWEANLTYGQVEKQFADQPMGQEAKFRNARLSYYMGDFAWAKTQLDVLKASTSQLIANDALNLGLLIQENTASDADTNALKSYAYTDLLIFKNQLPSALASLDSINTKYPSNSLADDILMAKAKIYLKQNDFQKAAVQLQNITDNYKFDLWADDALFMLADLYENKLSDSEKAKGLYQKIITDYPGSLFVIEARKRFRNLRGDKVGS
jgi:TolA-binding protein